MGKHKRKPFIDKKNSVSFHLVRRSQRDVAGVIDYEGQAERNGGEDEEDDNNVPGTQSDFVLMPAYNNSEKYSRVIVPDSAPSKNVKNGKTDELLDDSKTEWDQKSNLFKLKETFEQAGSAVIDDTYLKFTKPITGEGTFISATGGEADSVGGAGGGGVFEDPAIQEVERTYESITLNPDLIDPEIADALFGDWDDNINDEEGGDGTDNGNPFEELLDDFILTASEEPTALELSQDERNPISPELEFDYDAHIRELVDRARRAQEGHGVPLTRSTHAKGEQDEEFFSNAKALRRLDEGENKGDDADDDSFANVPSDDDDADSQSAWADKTKAGLEVPAGVASALSPEAEKALTQKFEATLAEYDTDDEEGYDDFDTQGMSQPNSAIMTNMPDAAQMQHISSGISVGEAGSRPGGDFGTVTSMVTTDEEARYNLREVSEQQLDSVLDNYLKEREEDELANWVLGAKQKRSGGSGHYALMNIKPTEEGGKKINDGIEFLPDIVEELEPPTEDLLIDGKSYFSVKQQSPWDCESVLSTYSNLDNNPAVINRPGGARRKKKNKNRADDASSVQSFDDEESYVQQIKLSTKTGLPLNLDKGFDGEEESSAMDGASVWTTGTNKGEARRRGESAEEKKARKAAIKCEKQDRRLQKKVLKEVFSEEFRKRAGDQETNDVAGLSVFRYS
jgi:protein LTV1